MTLCATAWTPTRGSTGSFRLRSGRSARISGRNEKNVLAAGESGETRDGVRLCRAGVRKSEIDSRNCAIRTLKEALSQREKETYGEQPYASPRSCRNLKKYEAEREGYARLRAAVDGVTRDQRTRAGAGAGSAAASYIAFAGGGLATSWRRERTLLTSENARMMRGDRKQLRSEVLRVTAERDQARSVAYRPL